MALIREIQEKGIPGDIAECGCYRCGATIAMAAAAPERRVWAFDLFGGVPYAGRGFENFSNADAQEIKRAVEPFHNIWMIAGRHEQMVPCLRVPLALIFLDSDFYESHAVCLQSLWPLLSPGGVAVFHDPGFEEVEAAARDADLWPLDDVPGSPNMKMIRRRDKSALANESAIAPGLGA